MSIKKPNFFSGLELGFYQLALTTGLAVISYELGCLYFNLSSCGVEAGIEWVLRHPVFPQIIALFTFYGFIIGAFGGTLFSLLPSGIRNILSRHQGLFAWLLIIFLILGFALWGVPNIFDLMRN